MSVPGLIRAEALERVQSPEQLDLPSRIIRTRSWFALGAVALLIVSALAWSLLGTLATTVSGSSVLLTRSGALEVVTPQPGVVQSVSVSAGGHLQRGSTVASISDGKGTDVVVTATVAGTVIENLAYTGDFLQAGEPVVSVQPDEEELYAFVYVSAETGYRLTPGMPVQIALLTVPVQQYGMLLGRVDTVSSFPATAEGINALLHNPSLAQTVVSQGPVLAVRVALDRAAGTPSGYHWSSGDGPPHEIVAGTLANSTVVIGEYRPITLLFPSAR